MADIDAEAIGTKKNDLSPTLISLIYGKCTKDEFNSLVTKMNSVSNGLGDIIVTIGATANRPPSPINARNVHMNMETNLLETYHDNGWHARTVTFK